MTPIPLSAEAAPRRAASPTYYVPLPRRLLEDCQRAPQAIAVYALIARLYRATRAPVPLSPADAHAYDSRLSPASALRALQRLKARGYLLAAEQPGRKTRYTPAWGVIRGAPRAWCLDAPGLGRPDHIEHVRLDQRLLDTCLGRLRPHPDHPAQVERYLAAPLLSLREVGAYACALVGLPASCPALAEIGLLAEGGAAPLPDDATILAIASQRALVGRGETLTEAGWRRTAWPDPAPPAATAGAALFFVPPDRIAWGIGQQIADPIMVDAPCEEDSSAAACAPSETEAAAPSGHVLMDLIESKESTTTPTTQTTAMAGGGEDVAGPPPPAPAAQEGEVVQRLRALGVRRDVAREFAARPAAQVARVIAQAQARPGVRDIAGWVVSALRALPAEESLPAAPPPKVSDLAILTHPGLSNGERTRWLTRFRSADPADRPAVLARFHAEHPLGQTGEAGSARSLSCADTSARARAPGAERSLPLNPY